MGSLGILILTFAVLLSSYCWGSVLLQIFRAAPNDVPKFLRIPAGLAFIIAMSGLLLAFSLARATELSLLLLAGVLLESVHSKPWKNVSMRLNNAAGALKKSWDSAVLVIVCSILGLGITNTRVFQSIDDYPTYLFFAKKIAVTGGLIEPFQGARLASYGASSLLQSLYLKFFGFQSVFAADALLGSLLLVILIVGVSHYFGVSRFWKWAISILVLVGTSSTYNFNMSPWFLVIYFSVVIFLALYILALNYQKNTTPLLIVLGLLMAALIDLRIDNAIAPCITVAVFLFSLQLKTLKSYGVIVAAVTASCMGWAIALFRSSKTPLYPLITPASRPCHCGVVPKLDLHSFISTSYSTLLYHNELIILLLAVCVAVYCKYFKPNPLGSLKLVVAVFVGLVVEFVAMIFTLKGFDPWMISRYFASTTFAVGICFVLYLVASHKTPQTHGSLKEGIVAMRQWVTKPASLLTEYSHYVLAAALLCAVCMSYQQPLGGASPRAPLLSTNFNSTFSNVRSLSSSGLDVLQHGLKVQLASSQVDYMNVNNAVEKHATVAAAVEYPELLNMKKFTVYSMGWPGGGPSMGVPYFSGPVKFMEYFKNLGIDYLIVQKPSFPVGLYSNAVMSPGIGSSFQNYQSGGILTLRWNKMIHTVLRTGHYKVQLLGSIALLSTEFNLSSKNSVRQLTTTKSFH